MNGPHFLAPGVSRKPGLASDTKAASLRKGDHKQASAEPHRAAGDVALRAPRLTFDPLTHSGSLAPARSATRSARPLPPNAPRRTGGHAPCVQAWIGAGGRNDRKDDDKLSVSRTLHRGRAEKNSSLNDLDHTGQLVLLLQVSCGRLDAALAMVGQTVDLLAPSGADSKAAHPLLAVTRVLALLAKLRVSMADVAALVMEAAVTLDASGELLRLQAFDSGSPQRRLARAARLGAELEAFSQLLLARERTLDRTAFTHLDDGDCVGRALDGVAERLGVFFHGADRVARQWLDLFERSFGLFKIPEEVEEA